MVLSSLLSVLTEFHVRRWTAVVTCPGPPSPSGWVFRIGMLLLQPRWFRRSRLCFGRSWGLSRRILFQLLGLLVIGLVWMSFGGFSGRISWPVGLFLLVFGYLLGGVPYRFGFVSSMVGCLEGMGPRRPCGLSRSDDLDVSSAQHLVNSSLAPALLLGRRIKSVADVLRGIRRSGFCQSRWDALCVVMALVAPSAPLSRGLVGSFRTCIVFFKWIFDALGALNVSVRQVVGHFSAGCGSPQLAGWLQEDLGARSYHWLRADSLSPQSFGALFWPCKPVGWGIFLTCSVPLRGLWDMAPIPHPCP